MNRGREFYYNLMYSLGKGIRKIRFIPNTENYEALIDLSALFFETFVYDAQTQYYTGNVLKMPDDDISKYLCMGDGIRFDDDPNRKDPVVHNQWKLFRHAGLLEDWQWEREEFCMKGFVRRDPQNNKRYRVIVDRIDDATEPRNSSAWEEITE